VASIEFLSDPNTPPGLGRIARLVQRIY
jgi:hypothetical protein